MAEPFEAVLDAAPPRGLAQLHKAVALISAMGKPAASRLAEHFSDDERARMLEAASRLADVDPLVLDAVVTEFENAFVAGTGAVDNLSNLEAVFERPMIEARPSEDAPDIWTDAGSDAERLAPLLENENVQLTVVAARRLAPPEAASLLAALPTARAAEVLRRLGAPKREDARQRPLIEAHLRALLAVPDAPKDDPGALSAILNELERDVAEALLTGADLQDEMEASVREGLFAFEDVTRLAPEARTTLFDDVPGEEIVAALARAPDDLAEAVLGSISPRTRRMVEAQRASASPAPDAVRDARRGIARRARDLAREGRIDLKGE